MIMSDVIQVMESIVRIFGNFTSLDCQKTTALDITWKVINGRSKLFSKERESTNPRHDA